MNLSDVTPVILTLNEAPNILRCLDRLAWAGEVVVLDSFSTDGTPELANDLERVRVSQRPFDDHASQWNHAIALATTPWVLQAPEHTPSPPNMALSSRSTSAALSKRTPMVGAEAFATTPFPPEIRLRTADTGPVLCAIDRPTEPCPVVTFPVPPLISLSSKLAAPCT